MEELMEDLFANISRECGDNLTCNLTKFACNGTWVDDQCLDEDLDPFAMPTWRKILWSIFFFIMVATADIGNMIVIWIVMSNARMRSVTNYFLINLSMADIINATFNVIPNFTYMLTGNWPFGLIFCKLGGCISILSVSVSVFTLVAISVDRYNAIINPLKPRLSKLKTSVIAALTWCLGLTVGGPMLIFFTTETDPLDPLNRTQCISKWPDAVEFVSQLEYWFNVCFMIMTYFLPMISMSYTYSRVGLELWGSRAIGEYSEAQAEGIRSKRKVVKMMMGVVVLFLVCWLPYHTYFITANLYPAINYSHYIQEIYLMIYWLAMSNSMYNPMIYCYMNQRFRKGFTQVRNRVLCMKTRDTRTRLPLCELEKARVNEARDLYRFPTTSPAQQNLEPKPDFSPKSELAPFSSLRAEDVGGKSPSEQLSINSVFPDMSSSPSPPPIRKQVRTMIHVHTFLNKARSRVLKVDKHQVCETSSEMNETNLATMSVAINASSEAVPGKMPTLESECGCEKEPATPDQTPNSVESSEKFI